MPTQAILLPSLPAVTLLELTIVLIIAILAYFVAFNNFEKHLPLPRRIVKLSIVIGTLAFIGLLFSRYAFWGVISLMTLGQIILHGWYFPKQGINSLTAEPYERYLAEIARLKGKREIQAKRN